MVFVAIRKFVGEPKTGASVRNLANGIMPGSPSADNTKQAWTSSTDDTLTGSASSKKSLGQAIRDDLEHEIEEGTPPEGHWLIDRRPFKWLVNVLIFANCVQMGWEVDAPNLGIWEACEAIFTVLFFLEMTIKIAVLRIDYFHDHWNILDCALVWLAVLDIFLKLVAGGGVLQTLSIFRVLRLFRLVRVLRLVRNFERLVLVICGVVEALHSTFWVSGVLFLAIYVCAILCVSTFGVGEPGIYPGYTDVPAEVDETDLMMDFNPYVAFGSMSSAMLTLFNIAIMAEWSEVVRPLMIKQPALVLFFIVFVMFVTFGIMNVIIGMIVDNVMQNAADVKEAMLSAEINKKKGVLEKLSDSVRALDTGHNGKIDLAELEIGLGDPDTGLLSLLSEAALRLPKGFTAAELLCMLDDDGDEKLDHEEFVQSFYRLLDGGLFQNTCVIQMGINYIKRLLRDSMKQTREQQQQAHMLLKEQSSAINERLFAIEAGIQNLTHRCGGAGVADPLAKTAVEQSSVDANGLQGSARPPMAALQHSINASMAVLEATLRELKQTPSHCKDAGAAATEPEHCAAKPESSLGAGTTAVVVATPVLQCTERSTEAALVDVEAGDVSQWLAGDGARVDADPSSTQGRLT